MKGIIKISAFALSLLTLASCTSDDFFGGAKNNGKKQLIVSVEATDGDMRSAYDPNKDMKPYWEVGDVFRVYDEALQKYDKFQFDGSAVVLAGATENVTNHAYAIFPGEMVYKAGWDEANGLTATMEIPSNYACGSVVVDNKVSYYGSQLPQFGTVEAEGDHLKTTLSWLSAFTDIVVYNQKAKAIRVLALKKDAGDTKSTAINNITEFDLTDKGDHKTPLAGYFDAQLKENGVLVADQTNPMTKAGYKSYIVANLKNNTADEAHVFIPIVPGTYANLVIQYTTDELADETALLAHENWVDVRDAITNKTIVRKAVIGGEVGTAPKAAKAISLNDLETILATTDEGTISGDDDYAAPNDVLNVELGGELKTEAAGNGTQYWLTLPDDKSLVVNIKGSITNNLATRPLTILGGANSTVVLNVEGGISGSESIIINTATTCNLILGGEFKSTSGQIKVAYANSDLSGAPTNSSAHASKVTFGYGDFAPFNTTMPIMINDASSTVTVDAGKTGSIDKIDFEGNNAAALTINSGSVNAIGSSKAGAGTLTVNENAKVTSIKARGSVTIKAEVETLTLDADNMQNITLEGSTDGSTLAKIGTLNINSKESPKVTSSGKAALVNVTGEKASAPATYTSEWNGEKIATAEINSNGEIYTAAQLGGVVAGKAYKLMTPVTEFSKDWTPVALNGNFDGNGKTLTGLNAALFSNVTGGTIKKLTLADVNIQNDKENQGALAQVVNGTVTISEVTVNGTSTIGKTSGNKATQTNIGGLVGKASGTVTLNDNQVTATVQGYANVGGYIGNFAGGSILFKYAGNSVKKSNVTYASTFTNNQVLAANGTDMNCGTFGHFIGSITSAASVVKVEPKSATLGASLTDYFEETINSNKSTLNFANNIIYNEDYSQKKTFEGRTNHEIGYCPVSAITTLVLYNVERDQLGNDIVQTIEKDVNLYSDWTSAE